MKITEQRLSQFDSMIHSPMVSEVIEMVRELRELRKAFEPERIDPVEYLNMIQADWAKPLAEQLKLITGVIPYHLRDVPRAAAEALAKHPHGQKVSLYATGGPWGIEETKTGLWVGPLKSGGKVDEIVAAFEYGEGYTETNNKRQKANAELIVSAVNLYLNW